MGNYLLDISYPLPKYRVVNSAYEVETGNAGVSFKVTLTEYYCISKKTCPIFILYSKLSVWTRLLERMSHEHGTYIRW